VTSAFGTDWFGKSPESWRHGNIRRFAQMKTGHTPSRTNPLYWEDTILPWFTLADVWQLRDGTRIYLGDTITTTSVLDLEKSAAELLPAGTVVLPRTRRKAVITRAVTKGLDPGVRMRSTGSPWFPSLPAPWGFAPIKFGSCLIQTGPFGSQATRRGILAGRHTCLQSIHIWSKERLPRRNDRSRRRDWEVACSPQAAVGGRRCCAAGRAWAGSRCRSRRCRPMWHRDLL